MGTRVLHQFPISHYCEKSRWHLEWKGLPYETRDLAPGVHRFVNRRLGGGGTVPLLVDDGRVVSDSTDIAFYLDERYPDRVLLPKSGPERAKVLELEAYFDDTLGPAVRRWAYGVAMETPGLARKLFFSGYGGPLAKLGPPLMGGMLEMVLRRMYRITPASIKRSEGKVEESLGRLEMEIQGDPSRYLVGESLTLADVTAASLLAPLVAPEGSPYTRMKGSAEIEERRAAIRKRVAGQWVAERYAKDRHP